MSMNAGTGKPPAKICLNALASKENGSQRRGKRLKPGQPGLKNTEFSMADPIATARHLLAWSTELVDSAKALFSEIRSSLEASDLRRSIGQRLCEDAQLLRGDSAHDLMPLDLAVSLLFRRVYEEPMQTVAGGRARSHLDGLAYLVSELAPIYVYKPDGKQRRRLSESDLAGALFQDGAKRIAYVDGRPAIENLAISVKKIQALIQALTAASKFDKLG